MQKYEYSTAELSISPPLNNHSERHSERTLWFESGDFVSFLQYNKKTSKFTERIHSCLFIKLLYSLLNEYTSRKSHLTRPAVKSKRKEIFTGEDRGAKRLPFKNEYSLWY